MTEMEVQLAKYIKEQGYNRRCSNYFEAGWKAALKWALSLNSVRVHDDVYEDIKKELNGKT